MKFWQSLVFVEIDQVIALAQFCEELGFYGVSVADHLVTTKVQSDDYFFREDGNIFWNPETHWPDPWALTTALSQQCQQLNFLSSIFILPMRDPFSVAKALSTAACLSNNRITMGIGVGWQKAEFQLLGQDFHTRGKRTDEMLQFLPQLMRGEMTEFHGTFYDFDALQMSPGTEQDIPIMIGGYAEAALRRAARHDGWMATSHVEAEIYPLLEKIKAIRTEYGDNKRPCELWSGVKQPEQDSFKRLEAAGLTMTNGTNFLDDQGRVAPSSLDDKKRKVEAFAKQFF